MNERDSVMRDVATAAADNREDADRYKSLADHNLQEYRKVRDRLLEVYEVYEQALRVIAANTDTWQGEVAQKALDTMRGEASR